MRTRLITAAALLALASLAACGGSSSKSGSVVPVTVTVNTPPPVTTTVPLPSPAPQTTATNQQTTSPTPPRQTRTAPAPAFAQPTGGTPASGDLPSAVAKIRQLGFAPTSTATYGQNETLRVLVGSRSGASHTQQAFFFVGPKYLGTDSAGASGQIAVTAHGDTNVTLRYGIYRPADADCCPSAPSASVRFELDGGRLMAIDPIPSPTARR